MGRGGRAERGRFASRPIAKHLGSYEARPDVVTEPRTTGPELMAVYPERGQQNTWEWISTRRNPGTARQRDEGAVYRAIAWPDRTNGPDRQSGCQEERIIVEEPPYGPPAHHQSSSEISRTFGRGSRRSRRWSRRPASTRQYGRPARMRRHHNTISNMPMGDGPAVPDSVMQAVVQTLSHIVGDRKRSRPNLSRANEHQPSMNEASSRKSAPEPAPLQVALDQ